MALQMLTASLAFSVSRFLTLVQMPCTMPALTSSPTDVPINGWISASSAVISAAVDPEAIALEQD